MKQKSVLVRIMSLLLALAMALALAIPAFAEESMEAVESVSVSEPAEEDAALVTDCFLPAIAKDMVFTVVGEGISGEVGIDLKRTLLGYAGTFYIPAEADLSKCYLQWNNADAVTVNRNGSVQESGKAAIAADGQKAFFQVKSGDLSAYYTFKTVQGSVRSMFLNIDESMGTIKEMNGDSKHDTSCYGTLETQDSEYYMSIKGRGNASWAGDKKPYNITMYKKSDYDKKLSAELIPGTATKKWSLLANYSDMSLMRNKIGYDAAEKLGIGLPSDHVDLWINGKYNGTYLLTPKSDYQLADEGFILELDNYADDKDYQFRLPGMNEPYPSAGYLNRFTVKGIGDDCQLDAVGIEAWMNEAWAAIRKYDSEEYHKYIDVDSWATLYVLHEIYKNWDTLAGSIMMHRDGTSDSDKLIAGPVWDLDFSLGRTSFRSNYGITQDTQLLAVNWYIDGYDGDGSPEHQKYGAWLQALGKHQDFMERVYQIYNEKKDVFNDIYANIDRQTAVLNGSGQMNGERWGITRSGYNNFRQSGDVTLGSGKYALHYVKTNSWQDYVQNLATYVEARLRYLSDNLTVTKPKGEIEWKNLSSGQSALEVSLTNGKNATYQWEHTEDGVHWTALEGCTEARLLLPSTRNARLVTLPVEEIALEYRCVVTNHGEVIQTERVAKAAPSHSAILEGITFEGE